MPSLSVMIKPASSMCNMQCDYCFYCDESKKRKQENYGFMSVGTLKNVIRKTMPRAEGYISYVFQGGEPLLRGIDFFEKVMEYQRRFNSRGIHVYNAMQTNGYVINEEWCHFFKKHQFLIGLSIDGTKQIHTSLRHAKDGANSFDRIEKSAELMDRFGVEYNVLTVVTPQISQFVEEVYQFYKKKSWNYQQYIACLDPFDTEHGKMEYSLSPEEYGNFLMKLFELWYRDIKRGRQPYIRQFENYIGLAAGYMAEACGQRGVCSLQTVVEADGSVYPCDFYMMDNDCLGNLNICDLDDINKKRKEIQFIERSKRLSKECAQCKHYRLCRGGCQRERDFDAGTGTYQNYFCKAYQMFFEQCEGKIYEIASGIRRRT